MTTHSCGGDGLGFVFDKSKDLPPAGTAHSVNRFGAGDFLDEESKRLDREAQAKFFGGSVPVNVSPAPTSAEDLRSLDARLAAEAFLGGAKHTTHVIDVTKAP